MGASPHSVNSEPPVAVCGPPAHWSQMRNAGGPRLAAAGQEAEHRAAAGRLGQRAQRRGGRRALQLAARATWSQNLLSNLFSLRANNSDALALHSCVLVHAPLPAAAPARPPDQQKARARCQLARGGTPMRKGLTGCMAARPHLARPGRPCAQGMRAPR